MSKHRIFVIVGVCAAVLLCVIMGIMMMVLDANSSTVANGITTAPQATIPEIGDIESEASGSVTSAPDGSALPNVSTIPTLSVTVSDSDTNPAANESQTTIKAGATVYIMNDLVGKNYDTVKNTSIKDNLTITPEYVYTDEYKKGIIFEQSIEKGSNYEKGAELTLKISMGPAKVVVPDFYGLHKKDYFAILNSEGIKYEEKAYETTNTLNDYVAWISIEPGEYIDLEAGEELSVFGAVNPDNTAPSETETSPSATTETTTESTPWVTTSVPDFTLWTEFETTPALTDEPDITIRYDY